MSKREMLRLKCNNNQQAASVTASSSSNSNVVKSTVMHGQ